VSREPRAESREPKAVVVLSTWPADRDVAPFARALVDERLAACVSVLAPMVSTYRWQGAIEESTERQLIIKTTAAQVDALMARVQALHPYEVPELLVMPIEAGSEMYLRWIEESVGRV
jgi:periplasmic divalent cation tolerance protein